MAVVSSSYAHASEPVFFNNTIAKSSLHKIQIFYSETGKNFDIAKVDLNNDGFYEFILKDRTCKDGHICHYAIITEEDESVSELATFDAHNISLSNHFTADFRDLQVFTNKTNDYDSTLYVWDNAHQIYGRVQP